MTIPLPARVATAVKLPTRALGLKHPCGGILSDRPRDKAPIRHCSGWGLPYRSGCPARGGLLPHRFTVTPRAGPSLLCGAFPGVAPAGRYPAPCLHGARTFLEMSPPRGHPAIRASGRHRRNPVGDQPPKAWDKSQLDECAQKGDREGRPPFCPEQGRSPPGMPLVAPLVRATNGMTCPPPRAGAFATSGPRTAVGSGCTIKCLELALLHLPGGQALPSFGE
jgi:hypothetical protein